MLEAVDSIRNSINVDCVFVIITVQWKDFHIHFDNIDQFFQVNNKTKNYFDHPSELYILQFHKFWKYSIRNTYKMK